jgi:hypothetical protein
VVGTPHPLRPRLALNELGLTCDRQFGYAESYIVNDATGRGNIVWTPAGSALKREMQKIFDLIAKDKGQTGLDEFIAFLNFLIDFKG